MMKSPVSSFIEGKLQRATRRLKYHLSPPGLILMYHRVTVLPNDPHLLTVSPEHFAEHLQVIGELCRPAHLSELAQAVKKGKTPPRAVAITFDDGYADNLRQAKPLLVRGGIPATVFVTAGQVGSRQEFWWDELDRLCLQPGELPRQLSIDSGLKNFQWDLGDAAGYSGSDFKQDRSWHIERQDDPNPRHSLFRQLFTDLYIAPEPERRSMLAGLREAAGAAETGRPTHQALSEAELLELAAGDIIEVGAHTMHHPALAELPRHEQLEEIRQAKRILETLLKRPLTGFAYPNGSYNRETLAILKEEGFEWACTSHPDVVRRDTGLFELPRLGVRDMDGETFYRWLKWWQGG